MVITTRSLIGGIEELETLQPLHSSGQSKSVAEGKEEMPSEELQPVLEAWGNPRLLSAVKYAWRHSYAVRAGRVIFGKVMQLRAARKRDRGESE